MCFKNHGLSIETISINELIWRNIIEYRISSKVGRGDQVCAYKWFIYSCNVTLYFAVLFLSFQMTLISNATGLPIGTTTTNGGGRCVYIHRIPDNSLNVVSNEVVYRCGRNSWMKHVWTDQLVLHSGLNICIHFIWWIISISVIIVIENDMIISIYIYMNSQLEYINGNMRKKD